MYHKQMPDVYLNQASLALQNQPDNTASILYHVSQDLTEVVSQESFQDDPCFNLFYGLVQYALWKDQYNIWNSQKQSQSQNISSMYSWDNDGEEEDNEFDGGGATSTTLSRESLYFVLLRDGAIYIITLQQLLFKITSSQFLSIFLFM